MSEYNKNTEEIPAPKAVEGYEPPRPIETIEGRHDRELKDEQRLRKDLENRASKLERRVGQLETTVQDLCKALHRKFEHDGWTKIKQHKDGSK